MDYQQKEQDESEEQALSKQGRNLNYGVNSIISERTFEDDPLTTGNREKSQYTEREVLETVRDRDLELYSYRQTTRSARSSQKVDHLQSPQATQPKTSRDYSKNVSQVVQQQRNSRNSSKHSPSQQSSSKNKGTSEIRRAASRSSSSRKVSGLDARRNQMKLEKTQTAHKYENLDAVISEKATKRQLKFEEGLKGIKPFDTEADISHEIDSCDLNNRGNRLLDEEGIILVNGKMKGLERFEPNRTSKDAVSPHERGFVHSRSPNRESISQLTPTVLIEKIFKSDCSGKPDTDRLQQTKWKDSQNQMSDPAKGSLTDRSAQRRDTNNSKASTTWNKSGNSNFFMKKKPFPAVDKSSNPSRGVSRNDSQSSKQKGSLQNFKGLANVLSSSTGVLHGVESKDGIEANSVVNQRAKESVNNVVAKSGRSQQHSQSRPTLIKKGVESQANIDIPDTLPVEQAERKKGKSLRYVSGKVLQKAVEDSHAKADALQFTRKHQSHTARPSRSRSTHHENRDAFTERSRGKFASSSEQRIGRISSDGKPPRGVSPNKEIELSGWQAIDTPVNSYLGSSIQGIANMSSIQPLDLEPTPSIRTRPKTKGLPQTTQPQGTPRPKHELPDRHGKPVTPGTSVKKVVNRQSKEATKTTPTKQIDKRPSLSRVLNTGSSLAHPSQRGKEALARELKKLTPRQEEVHAHTARSSSRGPDFEQPVDSLDKWTTLQTYRSKNLRTHDAVKQEVILHGVREKFHTLMSDINSKILSELKAELK